MSICCEFQRIFFCSLGLSNKCIIRAIEIIARIKGTSAYLGKNPKSIVAAVLYLSARQCEENISQREIANAVCVRETTIRKRYGGIEGVL